MTITPETLERAALLDVLRAAYDRGHHDEECPMLHYAVDDADWAKCACWFGKARRLLGIAK